MANLTFKQQKIFTLTRILGGLASAMVVGWAFVTNFIAGRPIDGEMLFTGLIMLVSFAYAGYYTRELAKLARVEQAGKQE